LYKCWGEEKSFVHLTIVLSLLFPCAPFSKSNV
jgi:hypothetical protein